MKFYRSKPPKSQKTFTTNLRRRRTFEEHPSKSFLQVLKLYRNQVSKPPENFKDFDPSKLHRIQAINPSKNFHHESWKIKNIRRIYEECKEQEISNKHTTRDSLQFHSKELSIHFPIQVEGILSSSQDYIDAILELKIFLRRSN